jgi:hypothetical protein
MKPGPNTGVLIPMVHVIEAANRAGCHLQHTTELTVMIDSALMMKELPAQVVCSVESGSPPCSH